MSSIQPQRLNIGYERRRKSISLTPLIDVVFILLLFFMLASSFQQYRSIQLDLPQASAALPERDPKTIEILILTDGRLSVNGNITSTNAVASMLTRAAKGQESEVIIDAQPDVTLQAITDVLGDAKEAGINKLSLGESLLP